MLARRLWIPIVSFLVLISLKPEFILPGGFLFLVLFIITNMSGLRRYVALLIGIYIYGWFVIIALVGEDTYFWPWQRPFFRTVLLPLSISMLRPVGDVVLWEAARKGMLTVKSCDDDKQAFHIESIYVDDAAVVTLDGTLARDVLGVASYATVGLGDGPPGSSMIDLLLRNIIFLLNEFHKPLHHPAIGCKDPNCVLNQGERTTLRLHISSSFDLAVPLMGLISSGEYEMKLRLVDRFQEPVLCLYAQLLIPVGANGEQFHRVIGLMGGTSSNHAGPFFMIACLFTCLRSKATF